MAVAISNLGLPIVVSCMLLLTFCKSSQGHFNKQVAFFIFGDSLVDPGNNIYINTTIEAKFWPYGESYFNPPSGRFSDGRIIPDFIAEFAGLPFIPAYLDPRNHEFVYGANFASAGAGALVDTFAGLVVNLKTQLQYFGDLKKQFRQNLGDAKAEQLLSDAVYLLSCNGNDYKNYSVSPYTHEQLVGMVIGNLTHLIKGIHGKGGRKFGIFDVPRLGCFPGYRVAKADISCDEEFNIIISLHNQMFSQKLKELENQLEGFMYAEFDFRTAVNKRMENPTEYGFKVGDTACCGSGPLRGFNTCGRKGEIPEFELCENVREYLFFDAFHPNEVACRQFAEMFWNGDSSVTSPYNLKYLFQGQNKEIQNKKEMLNGTTAAQRGARKRVGSFFATT